MSVPAACGGAGSGIGRGLEWGGREGILVASGRIGRGLGAGGTWGGSRPQGRKVNRPVQIPVLVPYEGVLILCTVPYSYEYVYGR